MFNCFRQLEIIITLFCITASIGCNKGPEDDIKTDCSATEITLSCDRPSIKDIETIYSLLNANTTNGKHILEAYLNGCFESNEDKIKTINSYISIDIGSKIDTLMSLNVITHELAHALSGRYNSINSTYCEVKEADKIWIDNQNEISIKVQKIFPAREILSSLIPEAVNSIYTEPYIKDKSSSTQTNGVFGLINEYNAYYQGLLTIKEMYPSYLELSKSLKDSTLLNNFVIQFENEISSYYTFKYYILLYINFAKTKHPKDYECIKNNKQFWNAYQLITEKYNLLIVDYKKLISDNENLRSYSSFNESYNDIYKALEAESKKLK